MKNQTMILLIIAGACGLVAMLGVKKYLSKQNQREEVPKVTVLVAQKPITTNDELTEMNTQFITVEAANIPEGVVTDLAQIKNRGVKAPRSPGDWILVEQLTEPGDIGVVSIPKGMRVTTIEVDANKIHSGILRPGHRIDVQLTTDRIDPETRQRKKVTLPVLQYVQVYAVGAQKFGVDESKENTKAQNISLLVTPEHAMRLETAKGMGKLSTTLRSAEDKDEYEIAGVAEEDLFKLSSELDERSALDTQNRVLAENPWLAEAPEAEADVDDNTDSVFTMLKSAMVPDNVNTKVVMTDESPEKVTTWTMAIYEGGQVRVEEVDLTTNTPRDTTGRTADIPDTAPFELPAPVDSATLPLPTDLDQTNGAAIDDLDALEGLLK